MINISMVLLKKLQPAYSSGSTVDWLYYQTDQSKLIYLILHSSSLLKFNFLPSSLVTDTPLENLQWSNTFSINWDKLIFLSSIVFWMKRASPPAEMEETRKGIWLANFFWAWQYQFGQLNTWQCAREAKANPNWRDSIRIHGPHSTRLAVNLEILFNRGPGL